MKIIISILLLSLFFLPLHFAQANEVKVIYFYPKDITPNSDINATLDTKMKAAQSFIADVMENYGYGRKTFQFESDGNGNVAVHHVQGENEDAYYNDNPFFKILNELSSNYNDSNTVYYVAADISSDVLVVPLVDMPVHACGAAVSNWAMTPAQGACFTYDTIAHEIGHTFGLKHNSFSFGAIDPMINNACAASWLSVHPFLNGNSSDTGSTTVNALTPRSAPIPGEIRFLFQISDPDGIHQIKFFDPREDTIIACELVRKESITAYLDGDPKADTFELILSVIDNLGNSSVHYFSYTLTELFNTRIIDISDPNLAAIIREQANIGPDDQITNKILDRITDLELTDSSRPISDLSALINMPYLETLLIQNQTSITDFSPIQTLTRLIKLDIINCGLVDLSILSGLSNLVELNLANNAIVDVSILSNMHSLTCLDLSNNQIVEFGPLANLTNLEKLEVTGNPYSDVAPLLTLQAQNPKLEISFHSEEETNSNNIPTFIEGESTVRWVLEKSPIGTNVGSSITATDPDNDTLIYSLNNFSNLSVFEIDSNTGQLKTKTVLDYITQDVYTLDITVTDGNGNSATISVTVHVAPVGQDIVIPGLISVQVSFSELMITSKGGLHSQAQWMELFNSSKTETANLKGWQLAIEARDKNGRHRHAIIPLNDYEIPPMKTGLIVTWNARQQSDIINANRVYNFFNHHSDEFEQNQHRNMIIGLDGFSLKLTNRDGILVDIVGNLDGDPSTMDEPSWEVPALTTQNGARTSLMRRYAKETLEPLDGTALNSWRRAADIPLTVTSFWGHSRDIGNPGFRGSGTLPVTLATIHAELTEEGAVLTWQTESEINNAGFYVLRSETRDGEYKLMSSSLIQGGGTTGQRKIYTWTDTTIQSNKQYYYRIEDVSFNGVRTILATTRLRGIVSARKKRFARWADLKSNY